MANHSEDFFQLKTKLGAYLDTINSEISELEARKNILLAAIELTQDCGDHCLNNNIGE